MMSLVICTAYQIFSHDNNEKNEMGGACGTYGGVGNSHASTRAHTHTHSLALSL